MSQFNVQDWSFKLLRLFKNSPAMQRDLIQGSSRYGFAKFQIGEVALERLNDGHAAHYEYVHRHARTRLVKNIAGTEHIQREMLRYFELSHPSFVAEICFAFWPEWASSRRTFRDGRIIEEDDPPLRHFEFVGDERQFRNVMTYVFVQWDR